LDTSFFILGPPRTGTTWLHEVLRNHAELPSPTKETRFFDVHFHRGLDWYRAHYRTLKNPARPVGEIAPTYFASSQACEHIARTVPHARVVCIFRNPVERLVSLYRVKCAYAMIRCEFEEALLRHPELLETSKYVSKLTAWRNALGPGQVLATVYDDLRNNPQSYLDRLTEFIGVPQFKLSSSQSNSVHASELMTHPRSYTRTREATRIAEWFKARRFDTLVAMVRHSPLRRLFLSGGPPFSEVTDDLTARLYDFFRPEVEQLEFILQRDLSAWKRVAIASEFEAA
jgi:hypothetical protein